MIASLASHRNCFSVPGFNCEAVPSNFDYFPGCKCPVVNVTVSLVLTVIVFIVVNLTVSLVVTVTVMLSLVAAGSLTHSCFCFLAPQETLF